MSLFLFRERVRARSRIVIIFTVINVRLEYKNKNRAQFQRIGNDGARLHADQHQWAQYRRRWLGRFRLLLFTEHKIIFQVLKTLIKGDKPADVHLVCEELKRQEKLKAASAALPISSTLGAICRHFGLHRRICRRSIRSKSLLAQDDPCRPDGRKERFGRATRRVMPPSIDAQQLFFQISQDANPRPAAI